MAGFVLVPLAACLVLSMFLVIERGRIRPTQHIDETGRFFLAPLEDAADPADPLAPRPWSEMEGWDEDSHPEVPEWARVSSSNTDAQRWALALDHGIACGYRDALETDAEQRHAIVMAAFAETNRLFKTRDRIGTPASDAWEAEWAAAQDVVDAARAGSEWARDQWGEVLWAKA